MSERGVIRFGLIGFGIALLLVGLVNWFIPDKRKTTTVTSDKGRAKVVEKIEPSVTTTESEPSEETETEGTAGASPGLLVSGTTRTTRTQAGASTATTAEGEKTTITSPSTDVTTTTDSGPSRRSESVTLAMFGSGLVLLLLGVLYPRILSLTLPGGAGLTLSSLTEGTEKVEERLSKLEDVVDRLVPRLELALREARRNKEKR